MQHHMLIAGTGRARTTFLVQYLHGCGLEPHLAQHSKAALYEQANAGLEDLPLEGKELPYVIKTPWLFEFVDRLLGRDDIAVDVVVLPMRDLVEAASSRVTLELGERYASLRDGVVLDECTQWENWGKTRGGVVYSLNPIDQARILAVGFHDLIHAQVKRGIPIEFLDFSRMIEDGEYLFSQLRPYLGEGADREAALQLHCELATRDLMRVGAELNPQAVPLAGVESPTQFPSFEALDCSALLRELKAARCAHLPFHKRLFRKRCRDR